LTADARGLLPLAGPGWAALWLVDLDELPPCCERVLPDAEHDRAKRFLRDVDRRRFVTGRRVLRMLLAEQFGIEFEHPFDVGEHGKPRIRGLARGGFNLSHSGRHAIIGVSHTHEIGVDVEELRPVPDAAAVARGQYSARECEAVEALADPDKASTTFLDIWTRKEACLKALGPGFSAAASGFDVGPSVYADTIVDGPANVGIRIVSLQPGPGLAAALARVEGR